jgi:hypothetical protein
MKVKGAGKIKILFLHKKNLGLCKFEKFNKRFICC